VKFTQIDPLRFAECRRRDRRDLDESPEAIAGWEAERSRYYAFTSLAWAEPAGRMFCGTTNFVNDLLHAFDPATGRFESMKYASVAEPNEIKIHRSLAVGGDGCVYGATSTLSGLDAMAEAPGGKLFKLDPGTGGFDVLGVPVPHLYIQTISLDWDRRTIHGMAYPAFTFFAFSLETRETVYRRYVGSISHIAAVDPGGGYWGTWLGRGGRHLLFRYEPDAGRIRFLDHGFPTPCRNLMYRGAGPIDAMIDGGDGYLYIGHESGELYRLDWRTDKLDYLAKPMPGTRLPALAAGEDGLLFGAGGSDRACMGFVYDRKSGASEVLGDIRDQRSDSACFRTHDCCLLGSDLYVGETDNPERGCYLWKCAIG
jgi:hypothetical protein